MKSLRELKERFGQTVEASEALQEAADAEDRDLSPEESAQIMALLDEHDNLGVEITRRERIEAAKAVVQRAQERKSTPQVPETATAQARIEIPRQVHNPLRAFRPAKGETERQARERAYKSGMWCLGTLYGNASARAWCIEHGVEQRTQNEGVLSKGGALVPDVMEQAIIDLREEYGVFRKYTKVKQMGSDHVVVPRRTGGVTAYAVAEEGSITESNKTWDQVTLTARKWAALVKISSELNEDAIINVAEDLAQEIAYAFATKEDDCAFNGDGTSTYHGITGILEKMIDGNHAGSYMDATAADDQYSEVIASDLDALVSMLPAYVFQRGTPRWYVPVVAKGLLFNRLANAVGGITKAEITGMKPQDEYSGYPIVQVPAWAGTSATTYDETVMVLFGDLSLGTMLGERRGTTVKVDGSRYIEYDQLAVVGTTRFDVTVHDIGGASTAGPIVGLRGNTS